MCKDDIKHTGTYSIQLRYFVLIIAPKVYNYSWTEILYIQPYYDLFFPRMCSVSLAVVAAGKKNVTEIFLAAVPLQLDDTFRSWFMLTLKSLLVQRTVCKIDTVLSHLEQVNWSLACCEFAHCIVLICLHCF